MSMYRCSGIGSMKTCCVKDIREHSTPFSANMYFCKQKLFNFCNKLNEHNTFDVSNHRAKQAKKCNDSLIR